MLIKAALLKNKRKTHDKPNVSVDKPTLNAYVAKLQKMLSCKTVYKTDGENAAEYARFYDVLKEEFPLLHTRAEAMNLDGCLVYLVAGKGSNNVLLMSHHDVVDASDKWTYPPFAAEIHDGKIYARGSVDTKTPLFAELQAVEELLEEGYTFPCNVYIASSNNEEVSGGGILHALDYFIENGVKFDFVLDEGGAVVDKMVPGVKEKCAMIAVHEKGRHVYKCTAKKDAAADGGHSGLTCKTDNPVARMAGFIDETAKTEWTTKLYPEVKATFTACAPYMSFGYRYIFGNIGVFEKLLIKVMPKVSAQVGGMLGTTMSFTQVNSKGGAVNIQAKETEAYALFRCVREDDLAVDIAKFTEIGKKYGVEVTLDSADYCTPANFGGAQFKYIEKIIGQNFPSVVPAPFLLTAGTDARRLYKVSDNILRFAPISLSAAQFATVHSDNENIDVTSVGEAVAFYKSVIKGL